MRVTRPLILLGLVLSALLAAHRGLHGDLVALLALIPISCWAWYRRTPMVLMAWALCLVVCWGSDNGPLNQDQTLNRFAHGGMAALYAVMITDLLRAPSQLAGWQHWVWRSMGWWVTLALGAMQELAEAAVDWHTTDPNRWHDTILDMLSNVCGATVGVLVVLAASAILTDRRGR